MDDKVIFKADGKFYQTTAAILELLKSVQGSNTAFLAVFAVEEYRGNIVEVKAG